MLNNKPLNTTPINQWQAPISNTKWNFTLNWLNISSENICVIDIDDSINTDLSNYNIPQDNGRWFLSYYKRFRDISLNIYIKWDTQEEFRENLELLRKNAFKQNALLEWNVNGEIRQTKVNCTWFPNAFDSYNLTYVKIEVTLESVSAFWESPNNQSTSVYGVTSDFQEVISNNGTAQSFLTTYIFFKNTTTNALSIEVWDDKIEINNTFSDNDVLKIDWENKRVLLNNSEIDYDWTFPYLSAFSSSVNFEFNWTFECNVLILNKVNYV